MSCRHLYLIPSRADAEFSLAVTTREQQDCLDTPPMARVLEVGPVLLGASSDSRCSTGEKGAGGRIGDQHENA